MGNKSSGRHVEATEALIYLSIDEKKIFSELIGYTKILVYEEESNKFIHHQLKALWPLYARENRAKAQTLIDMPTHIYNLVVELSTDINEYIDVWWTTFTWPL